MYHFRTLRQVVLDYQHSSPTIISFLGAIYFTALLSQECHYLNQDSHTNSTNRSTSQAVEKWNGKHRACPLSLRRFSRSPTKHFSFYPIGQILSGHSRFLKGVRVWIPHYNQDSVIKKGENENECGFGQLVVSAIRCL